MEFHGTSKKIPWNSMELFWENEKLEFHGTREYIKFPWNSMELLIQVLLLKFHIIPRNHRCCSIVVQKISWNSGESSMEPFDQNKFQ